LKLKMKKWAVAIMKEDKIEQIKFIKYR